MKLAYITGAYTYVMLSLLHLLVDYFGQLAEGTHCCMQGFPLLLPPAAVLLTLAGAVAPAAPPAPGLALMAQSSATHCL